MCNCNNYYKERKREGSKLTDRERHRGKRSAKVNVISVIKIRVENKDTNIFIRRKNESYHSFFSKDTNEIFVSNNNIEYKMQTYRQTKRMECQKRQTDRDEQIFSIKKKKYLYV